MKKILAIMALAMSTAAFAGSATVEYSSGNGQNATADTNAVKLSVREHIGNSFAVDASLATEQAKDTKTLASKAEIGGSYFMPLASGFSGYVRGGLGKVFVNGADAAYYNVEPGVSYAFNDKLSTRFGYQYQNGTSSDNTLQTRAFRLGATYWVTKTDAIGVRYDRVRGDTEQNVVAVNYSRAF